MYLESPALILGLSNKEMNENVSERMNEKA